MSASYTPLPERPRRYRVPLTPLADAMFQLLIFFMLTTTLTPFSLVTLRSGADTDAEISQEQGLGVVDEEAALQQAANTSDERVAVWELGDQTVTIDGQQFDISQLIDLAAALGSQAAPANLIISVTDQAKVQDVTSALEALSAAEVTAVQLQRSQP